MEGDHNDAIAAYACDPDNATAWYENIVEVEWLSPQPLAIGSRVAFVARFPGGRLAYTCEVPEMVPAERFVMSTDEGPFPMESTYTWRTAMRRANRTGPAAAEWGPRAAG